MARYDDLNTTAIAYTTFVSSIILVIIILLGRALCYAWLETEDERKLANSPHYEVSDQTIGEQKAMLNGYRTVKVEMAAPEGADAAAEPQFEERLQIPIDKAKELLFKELVQGTICLRNGLPELMAFDFKRSVVTVFMMSTFHSNLKKLLLSIAVLCALDGLSYAQVNDELPAMARGIDVEDKVGQFIPLELVFADENGNPVGLRKYFKQDKPIILTLNYSDCPGLCIAQLDSLVNTLRAMDGEGLGDQFEIVTVSIDPSESADKAARTKAKYVGLLRETTAEENWHFLTGKQAAISKLADSVGFRYTYDKVNKRFNHPAATYFISSDGRICRCLLSLGVEPDQLKLAVAEAGEGKLTYSLSDAFVQLCYMYDPDTNRYSASAKRLMAFGGAAFVLLMTGFTAPFWFSRRNANAVKPVAVDSGAPAAKAPTSEFPSNESSTVSYNTAPNRSIVESNDSKE